MENNSFVLTRREILKLVGSMTLITGCIGEDKNVENTEIPDPIDLSGGKTDDQGGMVIGEHFGPNGQIFYRENSPQGHDNPAWFHTLVQGLFPYYFEHKQLGWEEIVIYVTDYSKVDYKIETIRDKNYISSHTSADTFKNAKKIKYIAESDVLGGMGKELIPFSDEKDIDRFTNNYGGKILSFTDITLEWIKNYIKKDRDNI